MPVLQNRSLTRAALFAATRISLDSIVYAFREGCSPATICEDFEGLTLAHVYGAIAFYLDHQADVGGYLSQRKEQ